MKKNANRILAFAMAMTLLFGGTLGIEQVSASVANTDDGKWKYSFSVPKTQDDGAK